MSENFFNAFKNFKFEMPETEYTVRQIKRTIKKNIENLWTPTTDFLEKNEALFSGEVYGQVKNYQAKMHELGVIMREGSDPPPNINIIS